MVLRFGLLLLALSLVSAFNARDPCLSEENRPCLSKDEVAYYYRYLYQGGPYCYEAANNEHVCHVGIRGQTNRCNCNDRNCGCRRPPTPPACTNWAPQQNCKADKRVYCPLAVYNSTYNVIQHTRCSYCGVDIRRCEKLCERGLSWSEKDQIVELINKHRRNVAYGNEKYGNPGPQPPAGNMYELKWDEELAKSAQTWADQCIKGHDLNRQTRNREAVGQSIQEFRLPVNVADKDLEGKIGLWYYQATFWPRDNVRGYTTYGVSGGATDYTQMVWAKTKFVGCGYIATMQENNSRRPYKQVLICNYWPAGNIQDQPVYQVGKAGSLCPRTSWNGLCQH